MQKHICVLGSINFDNTFTLPTLPKVGQSVIATGHYSSPGGKGFNQSVAARRAGADVSFVGKVGPDGESLLALLAHEGIESCCTFESVDVKTGSAFVMMQGDGKNMIVVDAGANTTLTPAEIEEAFPLIDDCDVAVTQLETTMDAASMFFLHAKAKGKVTVLNPAPVAPIPPALLFATDILIPNETELAFLIGEPVGTDYDALYPKLAPLFKKGPRIILVTLGGDGVLLCDNEGYDHIPAECVDAVDSTAAGDAFIGALVSRMEHSIPDRGALLHAVSYAQRFAAYVVCREGAYVSMPSAEEACAF